MIIDWKELKAIFLNNKDAMEHIVGGFVRDLPERLDLAQKFVQENNWDEVKNVLHKIRGTAQTFRLDKLGAFVLELEQMDKDDLKNIWQERYPLLKEKITAVVQEFGKHFKNGI